MLVKEDGETVLRAGMCAGFAAGGPAHMLENRSARDVVLEIGDRAAGDEVNYPADDRTGAAGAGRQLAIRAQGRRP